MALLAYNRKKQFLAPDVEPLISLLTGFEEDDKNYQEVAKFFYYNIIHHNFATVDINAVQRSVEGIIEKFKIHGLTERGKRLQELVQKYVSSDSSQHSQLNVQWHVLLLLLKLSYNPTSLSEDALKQLKDHPTISVSEDEINWTDYLKEGWEEFQCPSDNSDEDDELWLSASEEDQEVSEPPSCNHLLNPSCAENCEEQGYGGVPHPSFWQLAHPPPSRQETVRRLIREAAQSEQWLRSNVQNSWWSDTISRRNVSESKHLSANMCEIWENHMVSRFGRDSSPLWHTKMVSELKVIQEVLWMLQVPADTCLFRLDDDGQFYVRPNVSLPTTIPDTLRLFLESLCPYFHMIKTLREFEEKLNKDELSEKPPPVTYKAYCAALFRQLSNFNKLVIDIETKLNRQDETMTLVLVLEELTPGLNVLHYLYDIHVRAVTDWQSQSSWLCATRLLSVLYEVLLETSDQMCLEASLHIFIHSFHVYLDIIDVWLSEGRLEDWRSEFLVIREAGDLQVMPYEQAMRKCGVVPVSLLSKLVCVAREAGRTMEVVSELNKLPQLRVTANNKGCLFKEFSENVYNEIKRMKEKVQIQTTICEETSIYISVPAGRAIDTDKEEKIEDKSHLVGCKDLSSSNILCESHEVLLNQGDGESPTQRTESSGYLQVLSYKAMYNKMVTTLLDNPLMYEALHNYFYPRQLVPLAPTRSTTPAPTPQPHHSFSLVDLMCLHGVLERQLELVVTRHRVALRLVTQTLRVDYSLLQHFTVLRNVFFMEAGNLAQIFYSYLFKEIESGMWNNSVSLSVQLQLCVEEFYPGFGNLFTVLIENGEQTEDVHKAIPAISLAYKVEWPVSLVITQDSIDSYNKVFRFLLHLKYAFWTLHNIRFSDLASSPNTLRVRRLHVLKLWMYHSTNTLHAYFMGLVLRSFSSHLDQSILHADSVDLIIQAHSKFLYEIKVHCLQDKKTHVETFIMKILRLCSTLARDWDKEADGILMDSDMHKLEQQYTTVYRGLHHCLEAVTSQATEDSLLWELKNEIAYSVPEAYVEDN